ncbi:MAG TPA: gliding motility-associated C-terminal domain-containing protein [Chryseolinea sp.]|nr:gliding motility-associated C-terminal domain-containing protein [Chryseolinea sp.]
MTVEVLETTAPIVSATVISNQTSCDPAQPTGSASANVAGSTSGYNFEWFKGQNTLAGNLVASTGTATGLTNAIYTVKATSIATGCFDTEEVLIDFAVVTPSLSISSSSNPTRCDVPNGSITMAVSLDTPADYTFSWYVGSTVKVTPDFTQTTETLTGLEPGHYTVKAVNNTRHCEAAAVTVTIINASPVTTFTTVLLLKPSTCNDSNGAITVGASASGNTSGFDFEWRSGQAPYAAPAMTGATNTTTTTAVTGLTTGAYTLITTNRDNGCITTHLYELPFDNAQEVNFVSKTDIASCSPGTDGSITVKLIKTPIGFVESDYRIDIFEGTNDLGAAATPFQSITPVDGVLNYTLASPLQPGSYTFVAVSINPVKNTFQCRSVPVTVDLLMNTQPPAFTALAMTNNMNCVGSAGTGTISLSMTSPSTSPSDYTFDWYEGADASAPVLGTGTSGVEAGINGEIIQNLPAGKYTVVITRTASGSAGCSATATYQIFDDLPTVSIVKADVGVTDINRCDMMSAGSVTVNFVSENGTKFPSTNYDFVWFNDSPSGPVVIAGVTTSTLINQPAGKYYVQPTNKISNCSTGELIEINILDKTNNTVAVGLLSFVTPTECLKPANILGEFEAEGSGTSASGYTYNWYAGPTTADPALPIANVSGTSGELAKGLTPGTYTIEVINNTTQCKITDSYVLPGDKKPVTLATSTEPLTVCFVTPLDGTVFATVTSGSKNEYTYNWYIESVKATADFTSTANSTVSNLSPGHYIVIATDNLNAACFVSDTTTVHDERVNPVATALPLNPLTICDPTRPDGVAAATVNGDFINYTFDWFNGPTPAGTSFYTGSQASNLSANTYSVIATSVITGCSDTTNVKIEIKQAIIPFPTIEILSLVTSCVEGNGSLTASVNGNTSDYVFDWYIGSQQKTSPDFTGEIYDELAVGKYGVTATSRTTGCVSVLVTEDVIQELVYPEFNYTTVAAMCKRDATESGTGLAAVFVTNAVNIGSIEWDVQGMIVTGPILSDIDAGVYPVTVTTVLGCATTKEIEIKTEIHPYNGISRNSDGQNDLFFINCIESFPSNSVKIFNRAGTLVYEAEGYDNNGVFFDGKSNKGLSLMGNNLPGGTYFFIIDKHDGTKPIAGYLELVN